MNEAQLDSRSNFLRSDGSRYIARSPQEAIRPSQVPAPPVRSRHARNGLIVFANFMMTSVMLVFVVMILVFFYGKSVFETEGPLANAATYLIKEGQSVDQIARGLESRGIITDQLVFKLGVRAYEAQRQMKAGEYAFKPAMSMREVMETIRQGKGVVYKVAFPEGLTTEKMFERLAADQVLVGDMPQMPGEGTLMPDTYPFQRGTTRSEVVEQMQRNQAEFLAEVWDRRDKDLPISTPEELVILASIVEKETGRADERPHVASVFINRLRRGMRLQSDPTILYGLFGGAGRPSGRPIYRSDIDKPTPYNTYVIERLPPGPIGNPGRAALSAVANPSVTEDLFFVADGTGGHVFARTLSEHQANVVRWRIIKKKRQQEAKAAAAAAANKLDGSTLQSGE